jgi:glutamate-1-semialdehyde 2,1-aminomutase
MISSKPRAESTSPDITDGQSVLSAARAVFPSGVVTRFDRWAADPPLVVDHAEGAHLVDVSGRIYIDCVLSVGAILLGHADRHVAAALTHQAARGTSYYMRNTACINYARKIVEATPCAEQVRFAPSGSEANMYACRLAVTVTGRPHLLKFEGAYHGALDRLMVSVEPSDKTALPTGEFGSAGLHDSILQTTLIAPYNDMVTTREIVTKHASTLAAIIVEPFQRDYPPGPGFLEGLRELADEAGILLIFDEVVSGFRFGWHSAQGYFDVTPDLATFGKAVGGGLPVGVVAGPAEIMSTLERSDADVWASSTMVGNPLTAASGLAALEVLERPNTYERLFAAGDRVRRDLARAFARVDLPVVITGIGPLFRVHFTDQPVTDYRSWRRADNNRHLQFVAECRCRGLLLSHTGKSFLSLAHDAAVLDEMAAIIGEVAEAMATGSTATSARGSRGPR